MGQMVNVALDAMGGDNAPGQIVQGAVMAVSAHENVHVFLVGRQEEIEKELSSCTYPADRITVVHASQVIEMAEAPVNAVRTKKDSSMVIGLRMVRDGQADAFISAGNSGALLAGAQGIVGRLKGVSRPPFASIMPTAKGFSLLLDCGANVDARADHLVQFARMGTIYMEHVVGVKSPSVAIINIGAEEEKGNALVRETFPLLRECPDIHFAGSCEARDITQGEFDILLAEGFTGNIVLKMYEGVAATLLGVVKDGLMSSLRSKIGALLIKPALKGVLAKFNADVYGGAPLLGLRGLVVKAHGNAKADVISVCIEQCMKFTDQKINAKIENAFAQKED